MSARTPWAALMLAAIGSACAREAAPAADGVGPASDPRPPASERRVLELARPDPPAATAPVPAPAVESAAPAAIDPDIADLGPFDVLGWDEAQARAGLEIQPGNADLELEKLRAELENRP